MKRLGLLMIVLLATAVFEAVASVFAPLSTYQTTVGADTVYWFKHLNEAAMVANDSEVSDYVWCRVEQSNGTVTEIRRKHGAESDTLSVDAEGLYTLAITNTKGENKVNFWCVAPQVEISLLEIDSVNCEGLFVTAQASGLPVRVYDKVSGAYVEAEQKLAYAWAMNDSVVYTAAIGDAQLPTPVEDGVLKLVVSNQSGAIAEKIDSIYSFGVVAAYEVKVRDREVPNEMSAGDVYSAPAEVEFKNLSKGQIDVSEWALGSAARLFDRNPVYAFQQSGEYRVALTVSNEATGCQSVDSSVVIKVTDAVLEFPDVFTPNDDGTNDEFRPVFRSLKHYSLKVFSRWGRVVYESSNPAEGWNGKIGGSEAPEGTYMYVAEAEGFDKGVSFRRKGTITLLRSK